MTKLPLDIAKLSLLACVCCLSTWQAEGLNAADGVIAFPGAVGQGAASRGGRGGDVYHVTNLLDYNSQAGEQKIPGSLRHAIRSATGPRTIVFDVAGAIPLAAPLEIAKSELTIAGQTAPYGGVTLWGYPVNISKGQDIVIRYLRVRLGDFHARVGESTKPHPYSGNGDLDPSSANAVSVGGGCERVILDHVSASWGMDETLSVTKCREVTIQHCIIASSLDDSFHPKGPHGYGSLVRGELTPDDQSAAVGGFSFYQNLWAHHRARNPSIGGQQRIEPTQSESQRRRSDVNLVNNVIFDWGDQPTHRSQRGNVRINLIGNYFVNGTENASFRVFREGESAKTFLYQTDNWIDADQDATHDGDEISTASAVERAFREFDDQDLLLSGGSQSAFAFVETVAQRIQPADRAYLHVINEVGCSLWRDSADQAVIEAVEARSGSIIDSQEELRAADGTLPGIDDIVPSSRPKNFDTDRDGMPNTFELAHGLNPNDPADRNGLRLSSTGYTNLEIYLAESASTTSE